MIKHQKDFLDHGPSALKPLSLKDIAEEVGLHPSTISRVTSNKYASTSFGLIPLKSFFSKGVKNLQGALVPIELMKAQIRREVQSESPTQPLSDQTLQNRLNKEFNAKLSRRSVAYYRESLNIPPSHQRKKSSDQR